MHRSPNQKYREWLNSLLHVFLKHTFKQFVSLVENKNSNGFNTENLLYDELLYAACTELATKISHSSRINTLLLWSTD